ncbi:MAG TPA: hypothetical protein VEC94_08980 [Pseudolabrys sp.]|nr:hypothetical protein [Pseudolabrys sp.]
MKSVKRFAVAAGLVAALMSGLSLITTADQAMAAGASSLNPYSLGGTVGTSTGTQPGTSASGTSRHGDPAAPSKPSFPGTPKASTTPAPSTASVPATSPGTSKASSRTVTIDRDHRPGGNADPCLQPKNTCSPSERYASAAELHKRRPDIMGLDGDPCMRTDICSRTQHIESEIARYEHNYQKGFCDSRITGQGCAQQFGLPNGSGGETMLVLHFQRNGGPLTPADRQRVLDFLHQAYNQSLGGGGGEAPARGTALKQQ